MGSTFRGAFFMSARKYSTANTVFYKTLCYIWERKPLIILFLF